MAVDTHPPRVTIDLGPPEGGRFREALARIKLPLIAVFWRLRTWWLLHRSVVRVQRWRNPAKTRLGIFVSWVLASILVIWGFRGIIVALFFREKGWSWRHFNLDRDLKGIPISWGAVNNFVMPVLLLASSTVVFLGWRLWRVRRFLAHAARKEPILLVQTAGSLMAEIVGRDQLSDAFMNNLRDRKARRPHVIVGGVGVGKTAVLVHLTERLAAKGAVPVPIRLRDVQAEERLDFCELARERFNEIVQPIVTSNAEQDRIWRWLRQRADRIVVLADGLEEALTDKALAGERDNVIRKAIRKAHDEHLPLVIASRPHDPLRAMQAAITELEPLSEEAALDYISRGGSWRSDPMLLDRVVEATKMVEAPLYLQIARDLHRKDLLEPLWIEAISDEPMLQDCWAFRQDLLSTWMDALIDGKIHPELPIDQAVRAAVVEFISALACIGLESDSATVPLEKLDPSFGTYRDGKSEEKPEDPYKAEWWNDRVASYLGQRMDHLRKLRHSDSEPRGAGGRGGQGRGQRVAQAPTAQYGGMGRGRRQDDPSMDVRLAATWGTRMGLVQESGTPNREPGDGGRYIGRNHRPGGSVHFQHSIIQAYLGSRFLPSVLNPTLPAHHPLLDRLRHRDPQQQPVPAKAEPTKELVHDALLSGGRELLIALMLNSRSLDGRCTCRKDSKKSRESCPVFLVSEQLMEAASELLWQAETKQRRLFRSLPDLEMRSNQLGLGGPDSSRRRALEFFGTAVEIASVDYEPQLGGFIEQAVPDWSSFGAGEDVVRLRETKLAVVEQCGAAARRVATDQPSEPAYSNLFEIGCGETDRRVRAAIATQIGAGREQAFRALFNIIYKRENIVKDERPTTLVLGEYEPPPSEAGSGSRERRAWQRQRQRDQERTEQIQNKIEADDENERWFRDEMRAWLLPMLVDCAHMTGHSGSPWNDLEAWINQVAGVEELRRGAKRRDETHQLKGVNFARGQALAEGFKYAANRRLTTQSNQEGREFLIKQAEELLKRSTFWYTRLTLLHALTLWALPDDVSKPQRVRGHGADPRGKVNEWLSMGPGHEEHPLVKEAGKLAVRALQTRRPERFLWIDDAIVASQIGTKVGASGAPRFHNLWIPPSTGWSSLDPKAQQLLSDVLLLVVLGERDFRPKDLFRLLERVVLEQVEKPRLPSCLSRDRTRLDPVRAVESDVQPGDNCRDDCGLRMCPYPVKAKSLRLEFSELFCLHQREMLKAWQPRSWRYLRFRREAPWQRKVPVAGMRRFWDEMGERARDVNPEDVKIARSQVKS